MKLRSILIILAVLAFVASCCGGYFYYQALRKAAFQEAEQEAASQVHKSSNIISSYLTKDRHAVHLMAGSGPLIKALNAPGPEALKAANLELDRFQNGLDANVCYLMDARGITIASSNRYEVDSFMGKDYSFRPYFKSAIQGRPEVYMALGVTSHVRGVYYSQPVYGEDPEKILGVAVIKRSVDEIEATFQHLNGGVLLLVDPHGVVFASNQSQWLFKVLWPLLEEDSRAIAETSQFGQGPWTSTGLEFIGPNLARDATGLEYQVHRRPLDNFPNWEVVHIRGLDDVYDQVSRLPATQTGYLIMVVVSLVGFSVFLLYRSASEDLARRRTVERELRESEGLFRSIVEYSHEGILIVGDDFRFKYVNDELGLMLGYGRQEMVGKDFRDFLDEESREIVTNNYRKRQSGEKVPHRYEFNVVRKGGEKRRVETSSSVMVDRSGKPQTVTMLLDITERKAADNALQESLEKYRSILESMEEGYFEADLTGNFTFANEAMCRIMDYSREELLSMSHRDVASPEATRTVFRFFNEIYRTGRPDIIQDYQITRRSGRIRMLEISGSLRRDRNGEPVGFRGVVRDVTERVQAQKAIQESEEKYRTILESLEEGYFELDPSGNFVFMNEAMVRILGYTRAELMGTPGARYCTPESMGLITQHLTQVFTTGQPARVRDYEVVTKSGETRVLLGSASLLLDSEGRPTGFRGLALDVTDRKRALEALQESEERYRTVLDANPDPVIVFDPDGHVQYLNPAFTTVFGWTLGEMAGRGLDHFEPEEERIASNLIRDHLLSQERFYNFETRRISKDGLAIPVGISAAV